MILYRRGKAKMQTCWQLIILSKASLCSAALHSICSGGLAIAVMDCQTVIVNLWSSIVGGGKG